MAPSDGRLLFILFVVLAPLPATAVVDPSVRAVFSSLATPVPLYEMDFELVEDGLMVKQDAFMAATTAGSMKQLQGLTVGPRQTGVKSLPPGLLLLNLIVPVRGACTMAFRTDNHYLIGYTNELKEWQAFPGYTHLIPTSTPLPITCEYNGDGVGFRAGFHRLPLGRTATIAAVEVLLSSRRGATGDKAPLQDSLATIIVTFPESNRFRFVRDLIRAGWETGTHLQDGDAQKFVLWGRVSCQLAKGWSGLRATRLASLGDFPDSTEGATGFILVVLYGLNCLSEIDALPEIPAVP